jgi:hypothetical protein
MHLECSIGLTVQGRASHRCWMVLGRIPTESSLSRSGHVLWGKTPAR